MPFLAWVGLIQSIEYLLNRERKEEKEKKIDFLLINVILLPTHIEAAGGARGAGLKGHGRIVPAVVSGDLGTHVQAGRASLQIPLFAWYWVESEEGRGETKVNTPACYAGRPGLGSLEWVWILSVWNSMSSVQHMFQELGTLVGEQSSRPAHNPLGFVKLSWRTHVQGLQTE